jgi:hypothetical protein
MVKQNTVEPNTRFSRILTLLNAAIAKFMFLCHYFVSGQIVQISGSFSLVSTVILCVWKLQIRLCLKFRVFRDVEPCSHVKMGVALMMEAIRTSETSVHFIVTTRRYIPEDSKLHSRRLENLKSQKIVFCPGCCRRYVKRTSRFSSLCEWLLCRRGKARPGHETKF